MTIYRQTTIGEALNDTLKELESQIGDELSKLTFLQFDHVVCEKFKEINNNSRCKLQGKCMSYNNCDDVWLFRLKSCEIKGDNIEEKSQHCRIVAIDIQNKEGVQRKEQVRKVKNKQGGGGRGGKAKHR